MTQYRVFRYPLSNIKITKLYFCTLGHLVAVGMEMFSKIRKELNPKLPAKALRLIWSCRSQCRGNSNTTCYSLYPGRALYAPSAFWSPFISCEISSMKKSNRHGALVCYAHQARQLPTPASFPPLLARPWLRKIRDRLQPRSLASMCWENNKKATAVSTVCISYFIYLF